MTARSSPAAPQTEAELEARLSEPDDAVRRTIAEVPGDIVILGAGGKMGPSLTEMVHRACSDAGVVRETGAGVVAVGSWM